MCLCYGSRKLGKYALKPSRGYRCFVCVTRLWFSNEYNSVYCIRKDWVVITEDLSGYMGGLYIFLRSPLMRRSLCQRRSKRRTTFQVTLDAPSDARRSKRRTTFLLVGS